MSRTDLQFIEDPQFLKWVFRSTPAIAQYWRKYIHNHPEEKEQILELKQRLSELSFEDDLLLPSERIELAQKILGRIHQQPRRKPKPRAFYSFLKYTAVALVCAVSGGLVVYLTMEKELNQQRWANLPVENAASAEGPLLITSKGENVSLKKSNSEIDYSHNGKVVLNNDSVMLPAGEPEALNQLVIPYGNQSKVVLADNSVVWLNAGSRLIYPTRFQGKFREVVLSGEAFFEVTENREMPFVVKTSDLEIKVLGTEFNVSAYNEDKVIQTVLKKGSVALRRGNARFFEKELVLKPSQMASFSKASGETKVYEVDVDYYTLWTKGLLSFDEVDYNRILKKVERFYNIRISFSEPNLGSVRISGKLDLERDRAEVFEYLERVSLTKIVKTGDNQYLVNK